MASQLRCDPVKRTSLSSYEYLGGLDHARWKHAIAIQAELQDMHNLPINLSDIYHHLEILIGEGLAEERTAPFIAEEPSGRLLMGERREFRRKRDDENCFQEGTPTPGDGLTVS